MGAQAWLIVAILGFSLGGIALTAAIILFVKLDIPAILGDLTGKTLAREIKAMRAANAAGDSGRAPSGKMESQRGKTGRSALVAMDKSAIAAAHASRRLDKMNTGRVNAHEPAVTEILEPEDATAMLPQSPRDGGEAPGQQGTTVLYMPQESCLQVPERVAFQVTRSVILTHTDEEI